MTGRTRTRSLPCLLGLLLLIVPGSALAQDTPDEETPEEAPPADDATTRARALFAEGVACVEQHETACAERAFRAALELRDAPAVRYNLASALFDLGRYPEAARLTASVLADESTPPEIRNHAEILQGQLQEHAGTLQITVVGADDAEVRIDGEAIPAEQRASVAVAPGARVVTVVRGDEELARREVRVTARESVPVELTVVASPEEAAAQAPAEEPTAVPLEEDWRLWAGIGGGIALAIVVAVIIAAVATSGNVEGPVVGNYDPGVLTWE